MVQSSYHNKWFSSVRPFEFHGLHFVSTLALFALAVIVYRDLLRRWCLLSRAWSKVEYISRIVGGFSNHSEVQQESYPLFPRLPNAKEQRLHHNIRIARTRRNVMDIHVLLWPKWMSHLSGSLVLACGDAGNELVTILAHLLWPGCM